jgi:hypothetical protein
MTSIVKTLVVVAAAACAAIVADPAEARGGGRFRARADFSADPASVAAGAKLSVRLREKSQGRFEFRMQMERAPQGLSPQAFIADAAGTLTSAGPLVRDNGTAGEYRLRVRGADGSALPAGATSIADLAGRAFEVREQGAAIFAGTIPSTRSGGGGADDGAGHNANDVNGGGSGGGGSGRGGADDGPNHN